VSEWSRRLRVPLFSAKPAFAKQVVAKPAALIAASYIRRQHDHLLEQSRPLSAQQRSRLNPFFASTTLNAVRLVKEFVPAPPLYRFIRRLGVHTLPELSTIAGITFLDVIVHSERLLDSLLFHEMVHVVQYEVLGLQRFAECYVRGFLSSGSYDNIPLETQAYSLGRRFEQCPRETFSVLEEVREWQEAGRF